VKLKITIRKEDTKKTNTFLINFLSSNLISRVEIVFEVTCKN